MGLYRLFCCWRLFFFLGKGRRRRGGSGERDGVLGSVIFHILLLGILPECFLFKITCH